MRKLNAVWLFLTFFYSGACLAAVADRIVVSVDGSPYSQRYVMSYFVVRELMQEGNPAAQPGRQPFLDELAANWKASLAKFSGDMVVRQESSRLGSFLTTPKLQVKGVERVNARRQVDKELAGALARLRISDEEMAQFVSAVLQVEGFRKNRERQIAPAGGAGWFDALMSRAIIRYFDGGDVWQPIEFPATGL